MNLLHTITIAAFSVIIQVADAAIPENTAESINQEQLGTSVTVVQLREDTFLGSPDGPSAPSHSSRKVESMEKIIANGIYSSPYHGYQIRIPKVANNPRVHVHQSLVSQKPDGTPITSHVLFLPDNGYGAEALVVTRLRDDKPKEPAGILSQFEPRSAAEYPLYEKQGVTFRRMDTPLGPTLQRTIRNRSFTWHFPYRVAIDPSHTKGTVGVSRYVVTGDFLCEFSVIIDGSLAPTFESLQARAEHELDSLMGAVLKKPQ